jgi:Arc/MetJ family transcription regulator
VFNYITKYTIKIVMGVIMRTTVTLDETLIRELMKFSDTKTKTAAVALAVKDQIRRAKLKQLASLLGTVDVDEKSVEESNEADMSRAQWLEGIGK